jgi:dGTPase
VRTEYEKDYDRLLFSTPVRRLADKTQVFPLEKNDSVRTRLTHSHEVSNLAKSIGTRLVRTYPSIFGDTNEIREAVPVILATVGLAHDLGNPPFGHQGEVAIAAWFKNNLKIFREIGASYKDGDKLFSAVPEEFHKDFVNFEGNAQALRLISRLQNTVGPAGLDLTAATIAALMKYPVPSSQTSESNAATKKFGYFASESDIAEWVRTVTGLALGQRHPLTWIMEAGDDIAYSVLDIEDTIKKGLVSPEDLLAYLRLDHKLGDDLGGLINKLSKDFERADEDASSLSRVREIKTGYLSAGLIDKLVTGATKVYADDREKILAYKRTESLLDCGTEESKLYKGLKRFARAYAYQSTGVLELEVEGATVIRTLMDAMWEAIIDREDFGDGGSRRRSPRSSYIYSLISDSYRWHFERKGDSSLTIRYKEMQLLTDMISGMTDGYAVDLCKRIRRHAPS